FVGGGGEALAPENVPEVRAAGGAAHLDPAHAEGGVLEQLDRVVVRRGVERGPAAAGVELGLGGEELRPAAAARVGARLADLLVLAAAGTLGRAVTQHLIGGGVQTLAPFEVAQRDRVRAGADGCGGHGGLRSATRSAPLAREILRASGDGGRAACTPDPSPSIGCRT